MTSKDRRAFQRMKLSRPILALMNGRNALILDVGISGAYVEHYGEAAPGERFTLTFRWQGHDLEFLCEAVRSTVMRTTTGVGKSAVSHTGMHFIESAGRSEEHLQNMMATLVGKLLAAQRSNATAAIPDVLGARLLAEVGDARRTRSRGFLRYRLGPVGWQRQAVDDPKQPVDGFTVAAYEDEDEIDILCSTYEAADDDARNMIRLVAELSARNVKRV